MTESAGKRALKRVRATPPLNAPATTSLRLASRLWGHPFEFAVTHLPRVGHVRSTLPNGSVMRLWSRGDDWVSNQVFWRGWDGYEPETTPIFFRLAERASVTVDIGAHVGFHTVLAGLANPAGRVFAFEPMPAALMRLRRHVQLNQLENADVVAAAVAAETGQAEFFHTEVELPCSASLDEAFMSWHADSRPMTVRTICLDEFLAERGVARVDLVKLDIETREPDALRGMRHMLARDHPPIVCEVLPVDGVAERLEEELRPLGYEYHHLTPGGPLRRDRIVPDPTYTNYLFSTR